MSRQVPNAHQPSSHEPWLERWKQRLGPAPRRALDLGCGAGDDAHMLSDWGHRVTAVDASASEIAASTALTPEAAHHVLDFRELPGPLLPGFEIIVAGLSLHYFNETDTRRVFAAVRDLLAPGGVFACRLNAEDDLHFGATGSHDSWAVTKHEGRTKQFFTEAKIRDLLGGWAKVEHLERRVTHRFGAPKSLYEVIAAKCPIRDARLDIGESTRMFSQLDARSGLHHPSTHETRLNPCDGFDAARRARTCASPCAPDRRHRR